MVFEVEGKFGSDRTIWFEGVPADMKLQSSGVRIESRQSIGDTKSCSAVITTDRFAKAVVLHGAYVFSDNYFDLLPGERKVVKYRVLGEGVIQVMADDIELIIWN